MFGLFYPDEYCESAYLIDFEKYYQAGYRGIIFDIDNTLVPHGFPSDEGSRALIANLLDMGYDIVLLSNNKKERVELFLKEGRRVKYICKANKPLPGNYKNAIKAMNVSEKEALFVGDLLFTDVLGAKKAGIRSVLTKPIDPKEEIQIVIKRRLEKIILKEYFQKTKKGQ